MKNRAQNLFEVEIYYCAICNAQMVYKPHGMDRVFPAYQGNNFEAQAQRAGLRFVSPSRTPNDGLVCRECFDAGKITFTCALCGKAYPGTEIQETFGAYVIDALCKTCYTTVSAEQWEAKCDELYRVHRYDYE